MFRAALVAALCGVLLPHGEGVRVQRSTPAASFVLKDNAYMVESHLRALMREGYTREDAAQSREDMAEEVPFVVYRLDGHDIYVSRRRFVRPGVRPLGNPVYARASPAPMPPSTRRKRRG